MGCGLSTMDATEDAPQGPGPHHPNRDHQHVPPVVESKKYCDSDDDEDAKKTKEEAGVKDKNVVDRKEERVVFSNEEHGTRHVKIEKEESKNYRNDGFIGRGSPSFRDYCNDHFDSVDPSTNMGDSNDCDSSGESKNGSSDDDSTNQLGNEKNINSKKEASKKKDRKGRGFKNVMNTGKPKGKKNLLNFACYNSSTQSYADNSVNKVAAEKTA